jgi:DNA-binding MarR family transcriptional regulator
MPRRVDKPSMSTAMISNRPEMPGPTGRIRRAHLAMQRYVDALFSARKITSDQSALLWVVWRRDGIRQNELAAELFTDPNTVTAMVVRLENRGLIRREVCRDDGRARRVSLTPAGKRLVNRLSDDWEPMRAKLREIFSGPAGEQALRILDEVREVMTESRLELIEQKSPSARRRSTRPSVSDAAASETSIQVIQ